jgi:hypothetical protein
MASRNIFDTTRKIRQQFSADVQRRPQNTNTSSKKKDRHSFKPSDTSTRTYKHLSLQRPAISGTETSRFPGFASLSF